MAEDTRTLDEEPKISKKAAKKAAAKEEKAAKKAEYKSNAPEKVPAAVPVASVSPTEADPVAPLFAFGWLKKTYNDISAPHGVITRFPPEPNGFLHIGHARAIAINFGFAKFYGGSCNLRYDDTNPIKEEEVYFNTIKESVEWLGYDPAKVAYASDNFDKLYELAEVLVKKGKAYVCFCTPERMNQLRGGGKASYCEPCEHRDMPIDESLTELRGMRDGRYEPKSAVLRMKMNLSSGNPNMWDMPAYRVTESKHHFRTADKWRIYPTYDFAHCLCDALEQISHSLCTTEFRTSRESYSWLVDELEDHLPAHPQQREYGRLKVEGTVLSKRKIMKLVEQKIVDGWDDPRLYTLIAVRRRGVPPGAIRAFIAELGVTDADTIILRVRFETTIRKYLENSVPRLSVVLDPVRVTIENLEETHCEMLTIPFHGKNESMGAREVPFTRTIFIERADFQEGDDTNFYRLAPGKIVGLLHVPCPIRATSFTKDLDGRITDIQATYEKPVSNGSTVSPPTPKAWIHWIAESAAHSSPLPAEVRIFNPLFKSVDPNSVAEGFLADVNPDSKQVFTNALIESGFRTIAGTRFPKDYVKHMHSGPWDTRFQGLRASYFAVDTDTSEGKVVLNKIVGLKEDASLKKLPSRPV